MSEHIQRMLVNMIAILILAVSAFWLGMDIQRDKSISYAEIRACAELKDTGNGNATGETVVHFNLVDGEMEKVMTPCMED